jgi:glycosyltransferase involved in cell wall biosynthesis
MKKFTSNSSYKVIRITDDENIKLTFDTYYSVEKRNFDIINIPDTKELNDIILNNNEVDAIVVQYKCKDNVALEELKKLPKYYLRKIYTFDSTKNYGIDLALKINEDQLKRHSTPMFSIITPLYKTKLEYFKRAYKSLCEQTLNDWEWVLVDDSPDELKDIQDFVKQQKDIRIKYYRISPTEGNIGLSKWRAYAMSTGKWLIEFDHDDLLYPWCLRTLVESMVKYPANKFIYTDNTTIDENDNVTPCRYGKGFCFGYGHSYLSKTPNGETIRTDSAGPVNNCNIRHIVGVPNHLRCWERNFYFSIGGHNQTMRIADVYELLVRTFLYTKYTHIPVCCYAQRFDGTNSQYADNVDSDGQGNIHDIQRRVRLTSIYYDVQIHKRLQQLGLDDSKWIKGDPFQTAKRYEKIHPQKHCEDIYIPDWAK